MPPTSNPQNRLAVVLLSGGLDSATALAAAQRDGFRSVTLAIDYGQRHRIELDAAALVSRQLGAAEHRLVKIDLRAVGGSALTADIAVPKNRSEHAIGQGVPITYVPARNLIFLSIATGLAETLGARDVFIGVNAIDYSGYPDCRPEFIDSFARTANLGTQIGTDALAGKGRGFAIHSPLAALGKADIVRLGVKLGVDYSLTTSCYDPKMDSGGKPLACGLCDSCQLRRRGFADAGVPDPTRYC